MVHRLVNDEKSVVIVVVFFQLYLGILFVMPLNVLYQGTVWSACDDFCLYPTVAFGKHHQYGFVNIIVYQYNAFFRGFYQICSEHVCVENLAIVKDSFNRG